MIWIDEEYINRLSFRLPMFKRVKQGVYNFRCPLCGDSKKSQSKARGYFYTNKTLGYNFVCHNGCPGLTFSNFLKVLDENLYEEYAFSKFKERSNSDSSSSKLQSDEKLETDEEIENGYTQREERNKKILSTLKTIQELDENSVGRIYVQRRKIPEKFWSRIYYAPNFVKFVTPIDESLKNTKEHCRIVIPYFNERGIPFRLTSRALNDADPKKYIQTILDDRSPRIFNMDLIDSSQELYVVEGQFDSMFIDNCVAVGSANYDVPWLNRFPNKTFIPDNQPRNSQVCKQIKKLVDNGEKVVLWKEFWGKDINQMITNGFSLKEVRDLLKESTFSGIQAQLEFKKWVKCDVQ